MAADNTQYKDRLFNFLTAHRADVKGMLLTEYNEAEAMRLFEMDGDRKRALKDIRSLMETLKLTAEQAMEALQIPLPEQKKYIRKNISPCCKRNEYEKMG